MLPFYQSFIEFVKEQAKIEWTDVSTLKQANALYIFLQNESTVPRISRSVTQKIMWVCCCE